MSDNYDSTWGTPMGQDCISLDTSLCLWLGDRLVFLAKHTQSHPGDQTHEGWCAALIENGERLLVWANHFHNEADEPVAYRDAQSAMRWVAEHLGHLWD